MGLDQHVQPFSVRSPFLGRLGFHFLFKCASIGIIRALLSGIPQHGRGFFKGQPFADEGKAFGFPSGDWRFSPFFRSDHVR